MNTASLELCQDLYKLSGWNLTEKHWYKGEPVYHAPYPWDCPAYDLGFLLEKLGNLHVELKRPYSNSEPINLWSCMAVYDDGEELPAYLIESANTPEDAACKLAIELFKHGVLKRK